MIEEYRELIALTKAHLPTPDVVIYAPGVSGPGLVMLQKMREAIATKYASAMLVEDERQIGEPKLLITTEDLGQGIYLDNLSRYLQEPERRRTLWNEIKEALLRLGHH